MQPYLVKLTFQDKSYTINGWLPVILNLQEVFIFYYDYIKLKSS